jgi:hypothetical protein
MVKKKHMIGAFIQDDFYLHFENSDILALQKEEVVEGTFATPSNTLHGKVLSMVLLVDVIYEGYIGSDITIDYGQKVACLTLSKSDFEEWLLNPTIRTLHHGPSCRFASCNVYISQEGSFKQWKNEIHSFMHQ